MILPGNILKRVGESRHSRRTPDVVRKCVSYATVEEDCTGGLVIEVFDDSESLVLILYFFMVAHKAACQTLSKALLKSMNTW